MRVIAGTARGRKLKAVPGQSTRPALERVRTSVFDILRPSLTDTVFLDLFAGTGAIGIEALSQGAAHCTFIDLEQKAIEVIQTNLNHCDLTSKARVRHMDAFRFLKSCKNRFDFIYIAPPQYQDLWRQAVHMIAERPQLLTDDGQIIVQIDPREYEKLSLTSFQEVRQKKYGNTLVVFFEKSV